MSNRINSDDLAQEKRLVRLGSVSGGSFWK
jgi:hypothetical protein